MNLPQSYRMSAGHCEACDKQISEAEMRIKGYNSGVELGLCGSCALWVNDPIVMDSVEKPDLYDPRNSVVYTEQHYKEALTQYLTNKQ